VVEPTIGSQTLAAQEACINHARDLLRAANATAADGLPHIAYHLATLAIEELGKRELIGVHKLREKHHQDPGGFALGKLDSHTHKLFWAFFTAEFGREKLTRHSLEQMRKLAEVIHSKRLGGLYVDVAPDSLQIPAKNVDPQEARELIDLATTRLEMAAAEKPRDHIPDEEREMQQWFLEAAEKPENQKRFFGSRSMEKLAEFKDARAWARWLRDEIEREQEEGRHWLQEELARKRPASGTEKKKWKIRIRLLSASHSIRGKEFNRWNDTVEWMKLSAVSGKKDQFFLDLELLDSVPVNALWYFGWGLARHFVTALNIGTMGFFWWRLPEQISRYYDYIDDLQTKGRLKLERSPILKVDWGANRVLTAHDLDVVAQAFAAIPRPNEREQHAPYDYYIGGVTFLSLNDIHWECQVQAFGNFFECLKGLMQATGRWSGSSAFPEMFAGFLDEMWPEFDERAKYLNLVERFPGDDPQSLGITLKEASFMKFYCDAFFLKHVRPNTMKMKLDSNSSKSG